jgi:hypothetical protein
MSDQRKPFSWEDWCAQPGTLEQLDTEPAPCAYH